MPKRRLAILSIVTTEGIPYDIPARNVESLRWAHTGMHVELEQADGEYAKVTTSRPTGHATLTMVDGATHDVTMDLPTYNALVADWALSAPGRTRGLQFAIRAHAKAGRLKGDEVWPRNKSPHAYGREPVGRPSKP